MKIFYINKKVYTFNGCLYFIQYDVVYANGQKIVGNLIGNSWDDFTYDLCLKFVEEIVLN